MSCVPSFFRAYCCVRSRVGVCGGVFPCSHLTADKGTFKENSDDGLTVFFDFFLTKFFRKRDVKEC